MTEPLEPVTPAPAPEPTPEPPATPAPAPAPTPEPAPTAASEADASLLALVDRLAGILDRSDLLELEVESGGTSLRLRKPEALLPAAAAPVAAGGAGATAGASGSGAPGEATADAKPARPSVKAPLTGIWYSAPSPGSAPFVQVGGEVAVGQVIGLIEAMKLFNEIKSDLSGRVVKVVAENGQLVKAKHALIEVEPL